MTLDESRRMAMLEATLKEILRVDHATRSCTECVSSDEALDGEHAKQWQSIMRKAKRLLTSSPTNGVGVGFPDLTVQVPASTPVAPIAGANDD